MAFFAALGAVTLAVGASAASVYALVAMITGSDLVPRTSTDFWEFGSLALVIGGFAVVMATRDELRARRRGMSESSGGLPGASA